MVRVFESLYWDKNKYNNRLNKLLKKEFKCKDISQKVILLPYRLIEYKVGGVVRSLLLDVISFNYIDDIMNLVFTVRNDFLKLKNKEYDVDGFLVKYDGKIDNKIAIDRFIELLRYLEKRIDELMDSKYIYAKNLAKYNLNRILLGPLQQSRELSDSEEQVGRIAVYNFIKSIIEDGLHLNNEVEEVSKNYLEIYMPTLVIHGHEEIRIYDILDRKISPNKNLIEIYRREERYRKWLGDILV